MYICLKFADYKNPGLFQDNQVVWQYRFDAEDARFYTSVTEARNFTIEKEVSLAAWQITQLKIIQKMKIIPLESQLLNYEKTYQL